MLLFWIIVMLAFLGIEAATVGLVSIWFAVGACAALIATALRMNFVLQVVIFLAVSGVMLLALKPFAKKALQVRKKPTNADRLLGVICPVTEAIDNITGTGAVSVSGKEWTARSLTGVNIPAGEFVRVDSIQGVKLIVEPAAQTVETE